jgi:hypothetical protein
MMIDSAWKNVISDWNETREKKAFLILNHVDHSIDNAIRNRNEKHLQCCINRHEQVADWIASSRLPLVFQTANEYSLHGHALGKALGIGSMSLLLTVDIYNPEQRIKFETFAEERLHYNILHFLIDNLDDLNIPSPAIRYLFRLEKFVETHQKNKKESPIILNLVQELKAEGYDPIGDAELREDLEDICLNYFANPVFGEKKIIFTKRISLIIAQILLEQDLKIRKEFIAKAGIISDNTGAGVSVMDKGIESRILHEIKKQIAESIEIQ